MQPKSQRKQGELLSTPDGARRLWKSCRYSYTLLPLLLLLVLAPLACAGPSSTPVTELPTANPKDNTTYSQPYTAAIPGTCDHGGTQWGIGTQFKAIPTPESATATALAQPTPTARPTHTAQLTPLPQAYEDPSTRVACEQNGLQVTHLDHYDTFATIHFDSEGTQLPKHYSTQITVAVVTADTHTSFDLAVRSQSGSPSSRPDGGYGNDSIDVGVDGSWDTTRTNDTTDLTDATFTRGYIQPAKTFTLGAEVDGPRTTFSIDNHPVTTIVDVTFPESYGIQFGISDPGAKSSPSGLFSHFVYTPLPDTHLSASAAISTATAQVAHAGPYIASTPGFGCDKGAGQWKPTTEAEDYVTTRCLSNGLAVSQNAAKYVGRVSFYGLNGRFQNNYKVKVNIDVSGLNGNCAGLSTHLDANSAGAYSFLICSDGSWYTISFDNNGNRHQLAQGQVAQHSSYTLEATSNDSTQSLSIDGTQVASVEDSSHNTTDHIELVLDIAQDMSGTAIFSNFVFTPLFSIF